MATLTINGQRVTVDDSFLKLSPEQQDATVDEIAASIGASGPHRLTGSPGKMAVPAGVSENIEDMRPQPEPNWLDAGLTAVDNTIEGIPFLGPLTQRASDFLGTQAGGLLTGQDPAQLQAELDARRGKRDETYPLTALSGNLTGGIAALGGLGALPGGAAALGMAGNLGTRVLNSGISSAGIAGADAFARGKQGEEVLNDMALGGAIGAGVPVVGAGLGLGARYVGNRILPPIRGAFNRDAEAARRVAGAFDQDVRTAGAPIMTPADEAMARQAGAPVINADRGGQATRTLARTAANISPAAEGTFRRLTDDRFATQGNRATAFIRRIMGGNIDDLALQDRIATAARNTNRPAYRAAYAAPAARAIWTPEIRQLMQSDIFRAAIDGAESVGTDFAAVRGGAAVRNPFTFGPNGQIGLRAMPDGSRALPSLEFWDIVQRNLRKTADTARRAGDLETADRAGQLRTVLNNVLDGAVPEFNAARRGAARFFDAEDALEAGRMFARQPKSIPEARRAHAQFTPEERKVFATGYASELIDTIKASRDRVNVINNVFGSQASRESLELALGRQRALEVEAYVRMEGIVDQLRTAVSGNSSTAKQLIAAGVLGGGVSALQGGDLTNIGSSAALFALGRRGLQVMGKAVDDRVMQRVGEILASHDPALLTRLVQNAMLSRQHMLALEAYGRGLELATKGAVLSVVGQN